MKIEKANENNIVCNMKTRSNLPIIISHKPQHFIIPNNQYFKMMGWSYAWVPETNQSYA